MPEHGGGLGAVPIFPSSSSSIHSWSWVYFFTSTSHGKSASARGIAGVDSKLLTRRFDRKCPPCSFSLPSVRLRSLHTLPSHGRPLAGDYLPDRNRESCCSTCHTGGRKMMYLAGGERRILWSSFRYEGLGNESKVENRALPIRRPATSCLSTLHAP